MLEAFEEDPTQAPSDVQVAHFIGFLQRRSHLRARGCRLLDTQWLTPHLRQFGGYELTRNAYLAALQEALRHGSGGTPA